MWDEPLHTPSAREDDLLAGIERHQSELTSPTAMDEWCDIGLLSDAHPIQLPEDGWTPISAWFAHNDMYARLWEPANGGSDVVVDFDEIIGVADSGKEKEKKDDDNNDGESSLSLMKIDLYTNTSLNTESLIDLVTERLNRSVTGQWPASSMEDSIDSLKSAMRKIKSIASPEESLKSREGRKWTSLLRL